MLMEDFLRTFVALAGRQTGDGESAIVRRD